MNEHGDGQPVVVGKVYPRSAEGGVAVLIHRLEVDGDEILNGGIAPTAFQPFVQRHILIQVAVFIVPLDEVVDEQAVLFSLVVVIFAEFVEGYRAGSGVRKDVGERYIDDNPYARRKDESDDHQGYYLRHDFLAVAGVLFGFSSGDKESDEVGYEEHTR